MPCLHSTRHNLFDRLILGRPRNADSVAIILITLRPNVCDLYFCRALKQNSVYVGTNLLLWPFLSLSRKNARSYRKCSPYFLLLYPIMISKVSSIAYSVLKNAWRAYFGANERLLLERISTVHEIDRQAHKLMDRVQGLPRFKGPKKQH